MGSEPEQYFLFFVRGRERGEKREIKKGEKN
jgi:hypothetical protein